MKGVYNKLFIFLIVSVLCVGVVCAEDNDTEVEIENAYIENSNTDNITSLGSNFNDNFKKINDYSNTTSTPSRGQFSYSVYNNQTISKHYGTFAILTYIDENGINYLNDTKINLTVNGETKEIVTDPFGYIKIADTTYKTTNPIFTIPGNNNITITINDTKYGYYTVNTTFITRKGEIEFYVDNNNSLLSKQYPIGILEYVDYNTIRYDSYLSEILSNIKLNLTVNDETKEIFTDENAYIDVTDTIFNRSNPIFTTPGNNNITITINDTTYGYYTTKIIFTTTSKDDMSIENSSDDNIRTNNTINQTSNLPVIINNKFNPKFTTQSYGIVLNNYSNNKKPAKISYTKMYCISSNNQVISNANIITLETLNLIFNKQFTNGYLVVYVDGEIIYNNTTTNNLTTVILKIIKKYLGKHQIKVEFTDYKSNVKTYSTDIIIN